MNIANDDFLSMLRLRPLLFMYVPAGRSCLPDMSYFITFMTSTVLKVAVTGAMILAFSSIAFF